MTPKLLISFQFLYDQPITFWAMPIPSAGKHPWLSKNVGFRLGKRPYAWEQNRAIFWNLVYPKCSKLEVCNPQVMILEFFSIIYKVITLKSFIYRISCGVHNYSWGLGAWCGLFSSVVIEVKLNISYVMTFSVIYSRIYPCSEGPTLVKITSSNKHKY